MSSNVGLSTPRGSGTSGYVQRNLSLLRPRDNVFSDPRNAASTILPPRQRRPDKEILEHDRRREIEVKVLELWDKLEDAGELDEDGIEDECEALRKKLTVEMEKVKKGGAGNGVGKGNLKMHQVHELAEVKIRESERLRRALGLKEGEFVRDGGEENGAEEAEHPMARQERRKREEEVRKEREEVERLERKKVVEEERRKREKEMEDEEMERRRKEDREAERTRRADREDDRDRKRKARRDRSDDDEDNHDGRESRHDDRRREGGGHRDRSLERDREHRGSHGEKRRRSRSRSPKRRYS